MSSLKEKLASTVPGLRDRVKSLTKDNGSNKVSDVSVEQVIGGMRGVKSLICDTSEVGLDTGLIIRNIPILDLTERLPEEILFLLLTGEFPNQDELKALQEDLRKRQDVPEYIWNLVRSFPKDAHPMVMLSACITALASGSKFAEQYNKGLKKDLFWDYALEDSLDLIAKIPVLAAGIYRIRFGKGDIIQPDNDLDWAANYAYMLGVQDRNEDFMQLMRLYMVLHSDHEGGNVSAFTGRVVASALSDPYLSFAAALNGLAGPLHGLANQECLKFVIELKEHFKGVPSNEDMRVFVEDRLKRGLVIPGYGHAVLRVTDPRFTAFVDFGDKHIPDDDIFRLVKQIFEIVPPVLIAQGKAKDPWPNVDAASGSLLYHYGITEFNYYTVLFGVSRALGICSQIVLSRAMGEPITRPKSITLDWLEKNIQK